MSREARDGRSKSTVLGDFWMKFGLARNFVDPDSVNHVPGTPLVYSCSSLEYLL
jgi:hypothetical protein